MSRRSALPGGGLCFLLQGGREEVAAKVTPVGLVDPPLVRVPYEVIVAVSPLGYSSRLLPPHLVVASGGRRTDRIDQSQQSEARTIHNGGGNTGVRGVGASSSKSSTQGNTSISDSTSTGDRHSDEHQRREGKRL